MIKQLIASASMAAFAKKLGSAVLRYAVRRAGEAEAEAKAAQERLTEPVSIETPWQLLVPALLLVACELPMDAMDAMDGEPDLPVSGDMPAMGTATSLRDSTCRTIRRSWACQASSAQHEGGSTTDVTTCQPPAVGYAKTATLRMLLRIRTPSMAASCRLRCRTRSRSAICGVR